MARGVNRFPASRFEFLAKPEEALNAVLDLPATIYSGWRDFAGFAGSLVMVSDWEARPIFWQGSAARGNCALSVRRVDARLAPYADRFLRAQDPRAHLPIPQGLSKCSSIDTSLVASESI